MTTTRRAARRATGFTLVEMLVSVAILAIVFGLMFRPLLMAMEVLSIGNSEERAQTQARSLVNRMTKELQSALAVYPNTAAFDLATGAAGDGTARWRTVQDQRLDLVLPARDTNGLLLTPLRPMTTQEATPRPVVVSYWVMREDPTKPYDPELNPRQLFRSVHAYQPATPAGLLAEPYNPDEMWSYALELSRSTGLTLDQLGTQMATLFASGASYDWLVTNLDTANPTAGTGALMRGPAGDPAWATYSNATRMTAVTSLIDREADLRELSWRPARSSLEELRANENFTGYRATLGRWVQPYQRETPDTSGNAVWVLPSSGTVSAAGENYPVTILFRPEGLRDASGQAVLGEEYFVAVATSGQKVGRPILYRAPDKLSDPAVAVYDLTNYPVRTFASEPGSGNAWSGEFACGIDWTTGEVTTVFEQLDVIDPVASGGTAAIHARNDELSPTFSATPPSPGDAGTTAAAADWQSFPLALRGVGPAYLPLPGATASLLLDDHHVMQVGGNPVNTWTSYTLSVFRPERLRTTDANAAAVGLPLRARQLNMSVVPGSERVEVVVGSRRRVYTPVRALTPGALNAGLLRPFTYHLDYATGRLSFYDPQLVGDLAHLNDGWNPPGIDVDTGNVARVYVTYEYRNTLPTIEQVMLGNDANREVVQATYRSLQRIDLRLVLEVPTDSTRGQDETLNDALAAGPIERSTGSRRQITTTLTLPVGSNR